MDKRGKKVKGQMQAGGEAVVNSLLRKQGITVTKVKKQSTMFSGAQENHRQGHHPVHPPTRDHDEGRRAAAAVI